MTAKRIWILLILTGVFLMHGATSLAGHATAVDAAAPTHTAGQAPAAGMVLDPAIVAAVVVVAVPVVATTAPDHGDAPAHGTAGHLWSLCLAVLAAVTVVGLVLIGRASSSRTPRAGPGGVRRPTGWAHVLRPPDLSVLCLLRI